MSKLNKIITNQPVVLTEEEIENLSATLAPVVAACGGGGGGTGGKIYTGIGFVNVNNSTNQIGLTEAANTKLNQDIPTKVSDLTDSANYQTVADAQTLYQTKDAMSAYATTAYVNGVTGSIQYTNILGLVEALDAKQDKLTFGYDENDAISSINSHEIAGTGGVTGDYYSASNPSGFINSAQAETQILAKKYITSGVSELDNFYSKTDTSSKTELQTKFDSLLDYDVVTGNSAVLITTADANNTRTFTISLTATPTAADTVLNGQNGVDATLNGNVWYVGLSQSVYNAVNNVQNKLDTTAAAQTYLDKTTYASDSATFLTAISTAATLSGDGTTTALGVNTTASMNLTNASAASALWAKQFETSEGGTEDISRLWDVILDLDDALTGLGYEGQVEHKGILIETDENYYPSAFVLTNTAYGAVQFVTANSGKLVTSSTSVITGTKQYALTTAGWGEIVPGASTVTTTGSISGDGSSNSPIGLITSAENALAAVDGKMVKPPTAQGQNSYVVWNKGPAQEWQSFGGAADNWANYYLLDESDPFVYGSNGLSAGLVPGEYHNVYEVGIDNTNLVANTQYAWTTTGWTQVSTPTIPDITATSGISANGYTIGLTNTAIDAITSVSGKQNALTNEQLSAISSVSSKQNELTQAQLSAISSVSGKVDIPTAAALADKYLVYSTNASDSGWCELTAGGGDYLPLSGGTVSGGVKFSAASGQNVLAVASAATLIGASRQTEANFGVNNQALGTTWMGVGGDGMHQGFVKYTDGGNVGSLDSNSMIQINFTPTTGNGDITVKNTNTNSNVTAETKIMNVPTASYNSMSSFDDTNGPNYMLRKTASGFDIGAAVINVTALPQQTEANAYYFIYEL